MQVNIRQEQRHGAARRDFPGFVQVPLRASRAGAIAFESGQQSAGEEAAGEGPALGQSGEGRPRRRQEASPRP